MQGVFGQTHELRHRWEAIYNAAANDPASWQRQLPNALKALIDNSLESLEFWVHHLSAKSIPFHAEHLVNPVATEFLPQLLDTLNELESGNQSQLNHFINELTHLMTFIHTMPIQLENHGDMSMSA